MLNNFIFLTYQLPINLLITYWLSDQLENDYH